MTDRRNKTIFALASARGAAGIFVVRISGKKAKQTAEKLLKNKKLTDKQVLVQNLICPRDQSKIDHAVVLYFAGPKSFTGEDVVELHCHGSSAVLDRLSGVLLDLGICPAEPGEFTRRAFENGQMDLAQAEGLADLIDARTDGQRQQALQQMGGGLREHVLKWRDLLLSILARLEAEIDFPDEEDVTGALAEQVLPNIKQLQSLLKTQLMAAKRGQSVRDGFLVALIGPVNAGKSTLLNVLAGQERAIVSDRPGTTRDVIEVQLQIGGFLVTLADTAGLRRATDEIEQEGIKRAQKLANQADLRLFLTEIGEEFPKTEIEIPAKANDLWIQTKADLYPKRTALAGSLVISAKTGLGIQSLLEHLETKITKQLSSSETPALTRARHVSAVSQAIDALTLAEQQISIMPELAAEHLRETAQNLAGLLGEVHSEQILDEIFRGFCIGK